MKEVKEKLDKANEVVSHFFSLGARVGIKDYNYVKSILNPVKVMIGTVTFRQCEHYGFYFRHLFRTFFVCSRCGAVLTKKQIRFYKKFNKR